jgi:hypothetical protein
MKKKDTFEVKNTEIEEVLKDLGRGLKNSIPKDWGFVLLLADYGEGGSTFYTSSVIREDAIKLMMEFIAKQQKGVEH